MVRPSIPRLAVAASLALVLGALIGRATLPDRAAAVDGAPTTTVAAAPATVALDAAPVAAAATEPPAPAPAPSTAPASRPPLALYDLAYADASPAQRLDLRVPAGTGPVPLVVYVHGGGWVSGDKAGPEDLGVVDPLVSRGFAVASINYRLAPEVVHPVPVEDVRTALAWLRANAGRYGVDPTRVALFGVSAGAQLASLAGLLEGGASVRAVVDWQGPVDIGSIRAQLRADRNCGGLFEDPDDPASFWAAYVGGPVRDAGAVVARADPRAHLGAAPTRPRFLVAHGDHDCVVPVAQSRLLADALRSAGDDVQLRIVPGAGHARLFPAAQELPVAADFLRDALAR